MKIRRILNDSALACAVIGFLIALFLTVEHNSPDLGGACAVGGCSGALQSAYGHVGPIPTAAFGAGMYAALVVLLLLRRSRLRSEAASESEQAGARNLGLLIWGIAGAGFLVSWWLQYVAVFVLVHFCSFCFASACLVSLLFLLMTWDCWFAERRLSQSVQFGMAGLVVLAAFLAFQVVAKGRAKIAVASPVTQITDPQIRDIVLAPNRYGEGDPKARYQVVEFMDYECPHCAKVWGEMGPLLKAHRGWFRLTIRHFPISKSWGQTSAEAALAAGAQGKFWQMHDDLFAHQQERTSPAFTLDGYLDDARACGLDVARFFKDLKNHTFQSQIEADAKDGRRAGTTLLPALYLVTPTTVWRLQGEEGFRQFHDALTRPNDPIWR